MSIKVEVVTIHIKTPTEEHTTTLVGNRHKTCNLNKETL